MQCLQKATYTKNVALNPSHIKKLFENMMFFCNQSLDSGETIKINCMQD